MHVTEEVILGGFHLFTCLTESFVSFLTRFASWIITCCLETNALTNKDNFPPSPRLMQNHFKMSRKYSRLRQYFLTVLLI